MNTNTPTTEEIPSFRRTVIWAAIWFVAATVIRLLTLPICSAIGLDQSQHYLLQWPVSFGSQVAMFVAALAVTVKFFFPNTLFADSGTRFNECFKNITNPFHLLLIYAAFLGPFIIAIAILAAYTR